VFEFESGKHWLPFDFFWRVRNVCEVGINITIWAYLLCLHGRLRVEV
jgi:hypothetical protein